MSDGQDVSLLSLSGVSPLRWSRRSAGTFTLGFYLHLAEAQAYLESFGLSTPTASLIYSLAALSFCWILLWLLAEKSLYQGLMAARDAQNDCQGCVYPSQMTKTGVT